MYTVAHLCNLRAPAEVLALGSRAAGLPEQEEVELAENQIVQDKRDDEEDPLQGVHAPQERPRPDAAPEEEHGEDRDGRPHCHEQRDQDEHL
eukprot:CAMPEP_0179320450 /NCGR_PEP_ID=MMETSP0797-20121207/58053_1 /TAXON_ID=47934 /ORGANISM="Dinophysis acuminata, Strain DAEP01" /LENGTH=91 /DNA_ID=CAMNT_0021031945 /DNA_START=168 /DNA_END=440 /DNA_ORIENTATION=+